MGWLDSYHSFSFGNYYNPQKSNFGALRVLNDDTVAPGTGFGAHPHQNMEIISIPLEGVLHHKDNMGNEGRIEKGDIQVMRAGTGIQHSEKNGNRDQFVKFLQIWIIPNKMNVSPRYGQVSIRNLAKENDLFQVLSPMEKEEGVWIDQNAWMHLGQFSRPWEGKYEFKGDGTGVYLFVIKGETRTGNVTLDSRDAIGVWETDHLNIQASKGSELLLIEVPMVN